MFAIPDTVFIEHLYVYHTLRIDFTRCFVFVWMSPIEILGSRSALKHP